MQINKRHFTEEEIAILAEALAEERVDKIPDDLILHMEECQRCKGLIVATAIIVSSAINEETESADKTLKSRYPLGKVLGLSPGSSGEKEQQRERQFASDIVRIFAAVPTVQKLAAVALVLIVIGTLLIVSLHLRQDSQDLFTENFTPYPDIIINKGTGAGGDSTFQLFMAGMNYYNRKQFDTAEIIFSHLYLSDPTNDTIGFYYGNILLAAGADPSVAIEIFSYLSKKDSPLANPAQWYLCLSYLKNNDLTKAKKCFESVKESSEPYKNKTERIIEKID